MSRSEIILIGPIRSGKSTIGALLAERLRVPQVRMDRLRFNYYKEIGYEDAVRKRLEKEEGFVAVYRYWKPFEAYAVERLLMEHADCMIDFGGGHSVYEDTNLFERVKRALAPFANVILLLPSRDLDESVRVLRERTIAGNSWDGRSRGFDFHEHFVKHHSNHDLAKFVVYTGGKTPEETRDEILRLTGFESSSSDETKTEASRAEPRGDI